MEFPLNKTCVTIEPLDPQPCDNCGDSVDDETGALAGQWATRQVMLDLRNNGQTICIGIYCDECAEEVASRLRDSLPDEKPDDDEKIRVPMAVVKQIIALVPKVPENREFLAALQETLRSVSYKAPEQREAWHEVAEVVNRFITKPVEELSGWELKVVTVLIDGDPLARTRKTEATADLICGQCNKNRAGHDAGNYRHPFIPKGSGLEVFWK